MIHGELFDLAGSRNAASTTQRTPGQDRTGGGGTVVRSAASRHYGLRLTNRGRIAAIAALLIAVAVVAQLVMWGASNWNATRTACDQGRGISQLDCAATGLNR